MHVRPINADELAEFDQLARTNGSVFHTSQWTSVFGHEVERYAITDRGDRIVGGLCVRRQRKFGLSFIRNLPFTPTCGPFLEIKASAPTSIFESRRKALEAIAEYFDGQNLPLIHLSFEQDIQDTLPFYWRDYQTSPSFTYLLQLDVPLEVLRKNMSSVRRRNISRARKDGLEVREVSDFGIVRKLVEKTYTRQRKKYSSEQVDAILFRFANKNNSYACATFAEGNPIACNFIVHDHRTAYYVMGGYDANNKHSGAGALSMFHAIQCAQNRDLTTFDFEGSMVPAIETYFRGFGGALKPYFTITKGWLPIELGLRFVMSGRA